MAALFTSMLLGGCVDCNSHVCRVTSKVAYDIYWVRTLCCEEPDNELCREMLPRIPGLTALVVDAKVACDQHNWDRMKQIWKDIRDLGLPLPYVRSLWLIVCDEDVEMACNSHPFFGPEDEFDFKGTFTRMEPIAPYLQASGHKNPSVRYVEGPPVIFPHGSGPREDRYVLSSGSLIASTWLGKDTCSVEGTLRLLRDGDAWASRSDGEFCKTLRPTHASFSISGELVRGKITLAPAYPANALRVDSSGRGVLSGKFHMELSLRDDPSVTLEDVLDEVWIELPGRIQDSEIHFISEGPISALKMFPVTPTLSSIIERGMGIQPDEDAFDSICSEIGRDAMEVFMGLFPECFSQGAARYSD